MNSDAGSNKENSFVMKLLILMGVTVFLTAIVLLMNFFFVKNSNIKTNMSTDKKLETMEIAGKEELISTQKYVSDLGYSMRYDNEKFVVTKYKDKDIYKYTSDERIMLMVEKSELPDSCSSNESINEYNNCYIKLDFYREEYYITYKDVVYKILVKTPDDNEYEDSVKERILYMISTFAINK